MSKKVTEQEYKIYKKLHTQFRDIFYSDHTPMEQMRMLNAIHSYEKENNIK